MKMEAHCHLFVRYVPVRFEYLCIWIRVVILILCNEYYILSVVLSVIQGIALNTGVPP
jgi:hypothetical protein